MTGERIDPYAVLGLSPQATQDQIRRAYRTLVRQNHHDTRTLGDPANGAASNARLQQVIAAYTTLGDRGRRADLDQGHHTKHGLPAGPRRRWSTPSPER